MVVSQVHDDWH
jgi:hypothetical protein